MSINVQGTGSGFMPYSTPARPLPVSRMPLQPLSSQRELTDDEKAQVEKGLQRWLPNLNPRLSTPLHEMLSSPVKSAPLIGPVFGSGLAAIAILAPTLILGAIFTLGDKSTRSLKFWTSLVKQNFKWAGATIAASSVLFIPVFYTERKQQDDTIIDVMRHYPPGATWGDMLKDPVYSKDFLRMSKGRVKYKP